ncbi:hypothetical protein [Thalassospira xiamenensis]|jgi:hypothetical protein|uniref:hypothetical protein n=1 Tax=Thalassospira xiamenensis TaxID=220697 RepID=UPI000E9D4DEA|nr:hypothetical protein [Thalassospira xiamenensis]HBN51983.1 hypothetical protein [Thalassospira sp.]|tara:strand:- start:20303 stop:20884 length:582 start_codon:yes stop_codon:yes gene_type:complete
MNIPKINEAIPLIGTLFGGVTIGVIARNSFVDWTGETLLAGLLGLGGGWLAYRAATYQQRATEESNSLAFKSKYQAEISEISNSLSSLHLEGKELLHTDIMNIRRIEDKLTEILSNPHIVTPELSAILSECTKALLNTIDIRKRYAVKKERDNNFTPQNYLIKYPITYFGQIRSLDRAVRRLRNYCSGDSVFL